VPTPYASEVDEALTAGSMVSSVHDMTKWMTFLLDSTRVGNERLMAPEIFSELFSMHMHIRDPLYPATAQANSNLFGYGFGWFLQDYRGHLLAMHTGSINGMVAIVALMPDEKLGVVVFGNRDHVELRHAIMYEVMDRYLGGTGKDWSGDLHDLFVGLETKAEARKDSIDALRVTGTTPTLPLETYAGTYRNRLYGDVVVEMAGNSLRVRRPTDPHSSGDLVHWNYDVFKWENDIAPFGIYDVEFDIDANRKLTGLKTGGSQYVKTGDN
jgi:hypothetical protein